MMKKIELLTILLVAMTTTSCTSVHDYSLAGKENASHGTTVYKDAENNLSIAVTGLTHYINQEPKVYEAIIRLNMGPRDKTITVYPTCLKLEILDQGKSISKGRKGTYDKLYSTLSLCDEELYPDKERQESLPHFIEVDEICDSSIRYRYIFRMPNHYRKIQLRATFEYMIDNKKINVDETIQVNRDTKSFWWIYI